MRFLLGTVCSLLVLGGGSGLHADADPLPAGFVGEDGVLTKQEVADGWIALFDGDSLFGWRPQKAANFRIEDRTIVADQGEVCLLCTTTQFSDYQLKVDFRADPSTNSGIFLRTSPDPTNVQTQCYELNIAPQDNPFPTGSLVGRQKLTGMGGDDQWHQFDVTMDGDQVIIKLDGKEILNYTDLAPIGRGFIGLQHNQGRVAFRNVMLKPLNTKPLFNGKDLSGWKTYPQMQSKFSVRPEGHLFVRDGKGQLETTGSYGDFVLQLECVTHGVNLNSGVFFRCIPGEEMNGYESQIHHGVVDDDRAQPLDAGTGAIFRRTKARRVAANDFEWFRKTLIAEGPHIAVWVNGYQVTDWVDRRRADANPRRGYRGEPGTIMLQGHDPTTEISFRNLRIAEMLPRKGVVDK